MRVFIVHAHHEPTSFNGALTRDGAAALVAAGHEVVVSDLYAMGFDPVSDRRNFTTIADPLVLRQQDEERFAGERSGFAKDVQAEIDKLRWCDALVLQFPIWWLGMPAILKGWIDRVFALDVAYGRGRWFDTGALAGRRAICSVTLGGPPELYSDRGFYGPIEQILHPIHRGILGFAGFTVVEPFLAYGPGRIAVGARRTILEDYRRRLLTLAEAPAITLPRTADYEGFVLRRAAAPVE